MFWVDLKRLLPPCHQNWHISPEPRSRDANIRYDTKTMFLDRLRLGQGVHALIRSIPDPRLPSWALESTLFWPSARSPSSPQASCVYVLVAETYYLRCNGVVFACCVGPVMSFQLRTPGHSRPSYWAGWTRAMTKNAELIVLLLQKNCFQIHW